MIYDHVVKFNGEYYQAGTEVPEMEGEELIIPLSDTEIEFETEPVKRGRPRKSGGV